MLTYTINCHVMVQTVIVSGARAKAMTMVMEMDLEWVVLFVCFFMKKISEPQAIIPVLPKAQNGSSTGLPPCQENT